MNDLNSLDGKHRLFDKFGDEIAAVEIPAELRDRPETERQWFAVQTAIDQNRHGLLWVDLAHAHLVGIDFSGCHLHGAILSGADLKRAKFARADLSDAVAEGAALQGTDFTDCDLSSTCFERADLSGSTFAGADLTATDLSHANLQATDLIDLGQRQDGQRIVVQLRDAELWIAGDDIFLPSTKAVAHWESSTSTAAKETLAMIRNASDRVGALARTSMA